MLPRTYRQLVADPPGRDFRKVAKVVERALKQPSPNEIVVRTLYAGINASDINISAGVYDIFTPPNPDGSINLGAEFVGEIAAVGSKVEQFKVGDAVAPLTFSGFAEYQTIAVGQPDSPPVVPIPKATPEILSVFVNGLTASIGLKEVGELKGGEQVLITAAAGGVGHYAVQLAKQADAHVIGTCSTDDKAEFLKRLGCDRPINYKTENLNDVLKSECPDGVNLVFENVGGEMFDVCLDNLAMHGRLVVCGCISDYATGPQRIEQLSISQRVLWKCLSVRGFIYALYPELIPPHMQSLMEAIEKGTLVPHVDPTAFTGLEEVADAVEYLHAGKNQGKVYVTIQEPQAN